MENKNEEYLIDSIAEGVSNCCGVDVILPDMCSKCKEHCVIEKEIPDTEKFEMEQESENRKNEQKKYA